jgi:hypothetical protein
MNLGTWKILNTVSARVRRARRCCQRQRWQQIRRCAHIRFDTKLTLVVCHQSKKRVASSLQWLQLQFLSAWLKNENRKPLIIRRAWQVGKSTLVESFAPTISTFSEKMSTRSVIPSCHPFLQALPLNKFFSKESFCQPFWV